MFNQPVRDLLYSELHVVSAMSIFFSPRPGCLGFGTAKKKKFP